MKSCWGQFFAASALNLEPWGRALGLPEGNDTSSEALERRRLVIFTKFNSSGAFMLTAVDAVIKSCMVEGTQYRLEEYVAAQANRTFPADFYLLSENGKHELKLTVSEVQ